jgi:pyridoxamine 5'-phosphate oxidase
LDESSLADHPSEQLQRWIDEAVSQGLPVPNGMALATVDADGAPSLRMVLLKGLESGGLVFFTNYHSRKACEMAANPRAALLFWWNATHRQVRVEGTTEIIAATESDAYFASRPRESNLSAMASPQSSVVASRAELEAMVEKVRGSWQGRDLERPGNWGGYRLVPESFEFFQGRRDRLHDRLRYRLAGGRWVVERLAP